MGALISRVGRGIFRSILFARHKCIKGQREIALSSSTTALQRLRTSPPLAQHEKVMFKLSTVALAAFGAVFLLAGQASALADNPGTPGQACLSSPSH